jgi:hypothetical protein
MSDFDHFVIITVQTSATICTRHAGTLIHVYFAIDSSSAWLAYTLVVRLSQLETATAVSARLGCTLIDINVAEVPTETITAQATETSMAVLARTLQTTIVLHIDTSK